MSRRFPIPAQCQKWDHENVSGQGIVNSMNRLAYMISALTVTGLVALIPTAAAAHPAQAGVGGGCVPTRPGNEFYEAGRVASTTIVASDTRCTTIAVSNIRDPRVPTDRCQTFLVAFLPVGGDPTYTEPVQACSVPAWKRTVLATNVPNGAVFRVLYQVDYIDPVIQTVRYRVWR